MEFAEVVRRRRMVRRYADAPLDPADVDAVLDAGTRGPSAGFSQGTRLLALVEPPDVAAFWRATTPAGVTGSAWLDGMRTAPVVVVVWADESAYRERYAEPDKARSDQSFAVPWWHVDAGMAALLVLQAAVDRGLGACFFGVPPGRWPALREAYGVPAALVPTGAVSLGHPHPDDAGSGSATRRPRRPRDEVVHHGRWGG